MKLRPIHQYQRIAVCLPNALGDTVMATPSLRRLADAAGSERLQLFGQAGNLQLLAGAPWFSGSIENSRGTGLGGMLNAARALKRGGYELAIIFPNSFRTALTFWLARVPERLGYYKEGRRTLLTAGRERRIDESGRFLPQYTGRYFDELLDLIPDLPAGEMRPELFTDEKGETEWAQWMGQAGLEEGERFFILVPGGAFGPAKIWLPERYAKVADALARERNARVLISYGPGEEGLAAAVSDRMETPVLPHAGVSLHGLKSIFRRAGFVLTNDTGPRHLAVAFGVPNVTIMGPNDPRYTHLDAERGEVVRQPVVCSPCQRKVCPLAEQVCMTQLEPSTVLESCLRVWGVGNETTDEHG